MDFMEGKIYRICVGDSYYHGSTVTSLDRRLYNHKKMMERKPQLKLYVKIQEVGWDSVRIELVEDYPCESYTELLQRETTYIDLSDPLCLNMRPAYCSVEEGKKRDTESAKKWRENNKEYLAGKGKEYKDSHPPDEEEREKRRNYQREYMKKRRASLPKKEKKKRTEEEIAESKRKKVERDTKARKEATDEVKEQRRIRHNEEQRKRRSKKA
jgi:hypothetical protein